MKTSLLLAFGLVVCCAAKKEFGNFFFSENTLYDNMSENHFNYLSIFSIKLKRSDFTRKYHIIIPLQEV